MKIKEKSLRFFASLIPKQKRVGSCDNENKEKKEIDETSICRYSITSVHPLDNDDENNTYPQEIICNRKKAAESFQRPEIDSQAEESEEERRYLSDLEKQLEEIYNGKKVDMDNIENWKNLQKFKVEQRLLGSRTKSNNHKYFAIDHLDTNYQIAIDMHHELKLEIKKLTKMNAKLQKEYEQRSLELKMLREQVTMEEQRKKQLTALQLQLERLVDECHLHQNTFQEDKCLKLIFQKTVDKIILLLQSQCTDDVLIADVTSLVLKKGSTTTNNGSSSGEATTRTKLPPRPITMTTTTRVPRKLSGRWRGSQDRSSSLYNLFVSDSSYSLDLEDSFHNDEDDIPTVER